MQEHKDIHFCGGLASRLKCDAIFFHLLELADSEASLEKCTSVVYAIEESPSHSMPAQTHHHLHLVHPLEILLLSIK